MKRYFVVRWKKRWRVVPVALVYGVFSEFVARRTRRWPDGIGLAVLLLILVLVVILFPFHWGGERGWDEKDWDE